MKIKRGYKFTNKNHTVGGLLSVMFAVVAASLLVIGIIISFQNKGMANMIVGWLGVGCFISSTAGFVFGMRSFKEKEKFYLFSWIGMITNVILWLTISCIIVIGM